MRGKAMVVVLAAAVALAALASTTMGATSDTSYQALFQSNPEPQAGGRWGERLVVAGDQNGDGVNDIFMAAPFADLSFPDQGRVYVLNGKDRSIIRVIDAPEPQAKSAFGFYISSPGDLNGDGKSDVVAGTDAQDVYTGSGAPCGAPEPNGCNEKQGRAWAFSGASGALLYTLDNPAPQGTTTNSARFGSRIGGAGDVTGDGVPDVIVGASGNDVPAGCGDAATLPADCRKDQGQAFIFNGKDGALVRKLDLPDLDPPAPCSRSCGSLGLAVQGIGDMNKDGVPDQQVDASNYSFYTGTGAKCWEPEPNGCNEGQGRVYVFSGKDGKLIRGFDDPVPQAGATFGFQDVAPNSPGDINGDGVADVYAQGFSQNGPSDPSGRGEGEGRAWVFSGATGDILLTLLDPTPERGGQFGWSMMKTDFNGDSTPDLYVGQSPHHVEGSTSAGGTYVFDGRDGSVLKRFELPQGDLQTGAAGDTGPALGWGLAAPGDLSGDGQPDYLASTPFYNEGGLQDNGRIYAFMSQPPATPTATSTPEPGPTATATATPITGPPKRTKVSVHVAVKPKHDRRSPYRFTVSGRIVPLSMSSSRSCGGRVSAQTKAGKKTVSTRRSTVGSGCRFTIKLVFAHPKRLGKGRLKVTVRFLGSQDYQRAQAKPITIRAR